MWIIFSEHFVLTLCGEIYYHHQLCSSILTFVLHDLCCTFQMTYGLPKHINTYMTNPIICLKVAEMNSFKVVVFTSWWVQFGESDLSIRYFVCFFPLNKSKFLSIIIICQIKFHALKILLLFVCISNSYLKKVFFFKRFFLTIF